MLNFIYLFSKFNETRVTSKNRTFTRERKMRELRSFFCHDFQNVQSIIRIRILRCNVDFYLYQTFEIFVMLQMKIFQNEEYNVDDTKLKKMNFFVLAIQINI